MKQKRAYQHYNDQSIGDAIEPSLAALPHNTTYVRRTTPLPQGPHQPYRRSVKQNNDAPRQLKFISAPVSANNKLDDLSYNYDTSWQEHAYLYH